MKATTKRIGVAALCFMCALLLGIGIVCTDNVFGARAEEEATTPSARYYYDTLQDDDGNEYTLAKRFYAVIDELHTTGDFKDGVVGYALDEILTSDQIEDWVINGNLAIPKAFGAARDCYFYDHPELFYVDLYKLSLSAARTSGVYSAYIDCGREADCYFDNGTWKSEQQVNEAIDAYNAALDAAVADAREKLKVNTGDDEEDMLLARYANQYLATNVSYDYEALSYIDENQDYFSPYTGNAYGALVMQKCVCRGYSFAFKAVLDKLNIPCIIVSGYSLGKNTDGADVEQGEAHSWNYVWLKNPSEAKAEARAAAIAEEASPDSAWYAFDVTWNSARKTMDVNGYTNMNAFTTGRNHVPDPVIASSGYKLKYPSLSMRSYGNRTVDNDFVHSYIYKPDGREDDYGNPYVDYQEWVGYKGQSAIELAARETDKLYILHHEAYYVNGVLTWTPWFAMSEAIKNAGDTEAEIAAYENKQEHLTKLTNFVSALYSQYAVVNIAPDKKLHPDAKYDMYYSDDVELGEHMVYLSQVYTNKAFGTYTPPPYVKKTSPKHTEVTFIGDYMRDADGMVADRYTFDMSVEYYEPLHALDETQPIGISFVTGFSNINKYAKVVPYEDGSLVRISPDGCTLYFRFKPSLMYEHNGIMYSFYFTNVGSAKQVTKKDPSGNVTHTTSDKEPNPVHFHFARESTVCSRILGGGRLWVDCCAQPTLVSNADLSAMDFKDPDGNSTFTETARSQMMLVVNPVTTETESEILHTIDKEFGIKGKDVKASETYDINLQICGKYPKIPDGSYVKIALGFPEGYGPEDEGVTFKLYHRKHISGDKYIIEEVPCVVTQFGIVATVTSFSPYTVVAVNASKVSSAKTVYATVDGKGGVLGKEDGRIQSVKPGESYTYTIAPDEGYDIYKVTLNGTNVTDKVGADGKLKLEYAEMLNNNELVIQYISTIAAQRYASGNIQTVDPVSVIVKTDGSSGLALKAEDLAVNKISPPAQNSHTALIVVCIVLGVVVLTGAAVATVFLLRRKQRTA